MDPADVIPIYHLDGFASAFVVYGIVVPLLFALTAAATGLWHRNAAKVRRLHRTISAQQGFIEGEIIVSGTVELESGSDRTVRVEVEQQGEEWQSGQWLHRWVESDRRVQVAPFYLRHGSGLRLRVEPTTEKSFLVDDLDDVIWIDTTKRVRVGELAPGAEVTIHGFLTKGADPESEQRGYRRGAEGWILKPPDDGPMMFSSTSLEDHAERSARLYKLVTLFLAMLFTGANAALFDYHLETIAGTTIDATITAIERRTTDSRGDPFPYSKLTLSAPAHQLESVVQNISREYDEVLHVGTHVPLRTVSFYRRATQIGSKATVGTRRLSFMIPIMLLACVVFFFVWVFAPRHWQVGSPIAVAYSGKLPRTETEREASRRYDE